MTRSRNICTY